MKVVVLGTRGFPGVQGGVEKHCEELYPRLVGLGCDIVVITRNPYIPKPERVKEWKGVKFIHLWCPRKKASEAIIHTLAGVIKTKILRPDILHLHSIGPSLLAPFAKSLGLKTVMTHHGPDYQREKWGYVAKSVLRQGEKLGVSYSDRIIAVSEGIQRHIRRKFDKEAAFIPNGVTILPATPPGEGLKRWGLESRRYAFTACRFVPEKGLHDLVEAYRMLENPSFRLVIAGDADHKTDYSRTLKRCISDAAGVVSTGFVSGAMLSELYSNAGLFVLPSYYEGLPLALLEALSYGIPVLVSDIPQHKEIPLSEFRYFPQGNVKKLSQSLAGVFSRGVSDAEKQNYLCLLKDRYDWDDIASMTFELYRNLAQELTTD